MIDRPLLPISLLTKSATIDLAQVVSEDPVPKVEAIVKAMADEVSTLMRAAPHYIRPSKRAKNKFRQ